MSRASATMLRIVSVTLATIALSELAALAWLRGFTGAFVLPFSLGLVAFGALLVAPMRHPTEKLSLQLWLLAILAVLAAGQADAFRHFPHCRPAFTGTWGVILFGVFTMMVGNFYPKYRVDQCNDLTLDESQSGRTRRRIGRLLMACGAAAVIAALVFGAHDWLLFYLPAFFLMNLLWLRAPWLPRPRRP